MITSFFLCSSPCELRFYNDNSQIKIWPRIQNAILDHSKPYAPNAAPLSGFLAKERIGVYFPAFYLLVEFRNALLFLPLGKTAHLLDHPLHPA